MAITSSAAPPVKHLTQLLNQTDNKYMWAESPLANCANSWIKMPLVKKLGTLKLKKKKHFFDFAGNTVTNSPLVPSAVLCISQCTWPLMALQHSLPHCSLFVTMCILFGFLSCPLPCPATGYFPVVSWSLSSVSLEDLAFPLLFMKYILCVLHQSIPSPFVLHYSG